MVRLSAFSVWHGSLFGPNIVVYVINVLLEVTSRFSLQREFAVCLILVFDSHCPWVWNCGQFYLVISRKLLGTDVII